MNRPAIFALGLGTLGACGGTVGAAVDGGPPEAGADVTVIDVVSPPPDATIDSAPSDATGDTSSDVVDASLADALPTFSSACSPAQRVHTQSGPDQGSAGCTNADGGALELLYQYPAPPLAFGFPPDLAQQIAVDDTNLYWIEVDGVVKADKTGMPINKFCIPQGTVEALVKDGDILYVATSNPQSNVVLQIATGGGDWTQLGTASALPMWLAVDPAYVYWLETDSPQVSSGDRVIQIAKDGSRKRIILSEAPSGLFTMLSDGATLFSTASDPNHTGFDSVLATTLVAAPQTTELALGSYGPPAGLGVDSTHVYWVDGVPATGSIWKVSKDGSGQALLARAQIWASGLTVDGTFAYWGENAITSLGALHIHKTDTTTGTTNTILAKSTAYPNGFMSGPTQGESEWVIDMATDATALYFTTLVQNPGNLYKICK